MRIYDVNISGPSVGESNRSQEAQRPGSRANGAGASGSGDRVELSSSLGRLSHAMAAFESSRSERVQALAAQYQSGNYRPDSKATSRAMVAQSISLGEQ